jgi:hypothetical protein
MAIAIIEIQAGKFDPNGKPIIQNCYIADLHIVMIDPDTGDIQRAHYTPNPMMEEQRRGFASKYPRTPFAQIAQQVQEFLGDCDYMGYCLRKLDLPLLAEEFARAGIDGFPNENVNVIDVQSIYHQMEPRTLPAAVRFYLGREYGNRSRSTSDAELVFEIFEKQKQLYGLTEQLDDLHMFSAFGKNVADFAGLVYYASGTKLVWNFGKQKDLPVRAEDPFTIWFLKGEFPAQSKRIVSEFCNIKTF